MGLGEVIWKWVVKNAYDYGKADLKAVTGKTINEWPDSKKDMKKTMQLIQEAIDKASKLSKPQLEEELKNFVFEEKKEEPKKITLPQAVQGKVVTRFAPEPNAYLHIGHAKAVFLSYEGAKNHGGKCLLRFDDTNPEVESQEFVQAIKEALNWLGVKFDGEGYASDKMDVYYSHAEKLIAQGDAYVCQCPKEEMSANRSAKKACAHRSQPVTKNKELWQQMVGKKLGEGEATLRFKGDMESFNTVMRDPTLARIIPAEHYRHGEKYAVWPTYDFETCIADSLDGVTHALRSKEYELRDELYYAVLDKLKLRKPLVYDFSRLEIKGTVLSKRLIKPLVEEKKVMGWDDPRLPTLFGLRRRGLAPEAIKEFVLSFGLSKVESEPDWEALLVENRKLLDPISDRYAFVKNPVKLVVEKATMEKAKVTKNPLKGDEHREIATGKEFWVDGSDAKDLAAGEAFRLKDLYNVKVTSKDNNSVNAEFAGRELVQKSKKIQWVPLEGALSCEILVPGDLFKGEEFNPNSLTVEKGYCEKACSSLKQGTVIQFTRYGFVRLDDAKKMTFIYSC